jgi:hypothetical protein
VHSVALAVALILSGTAGRAESAIALQGTVTDGTTAVLGGASVGAPCGSTLTDGAGQYSLTEEQLCFTSDGTVTFQLTGYYQHSEPYAIAAMPTTVDASLVPGGPVVQGTVTDANTAAPIAGAFVAVCILELPAGCIGATTGPDGRYAFDSSQIPDSLPGTLHAYFERVTATGYLEYLSACCDVLFTISPPLPVTRDFVLTPTAGVLLQGTVTDRVTAAPLAGVSVGAPCGSTLTDGAGQYSFTAEQLCFTFDGTVTFQAPGYYQHSEPYAIAAVPTTVDASLQPGGALVQGTVTDTNTAAPIAGAFVSLCILELPAGCIGTTTGLDGRYAFDSSQIPDSLPGTLHVFFERVTAAGYFEYLSACCDALFTISPPLPVTRNFSLVPAGVALHGTVIDGTTMAPLGGVSVGAPCGSTLTDGTGRYSFTGEQLCFTLAGTVTFQALGYYQHSEPYAIATVPTTVDASLLPGGALVQGTVTDTSTAAPIAGAFVSLCILELPAGCIGTATGLDGRYAFDSSQIPDSLPGTLHVFFEAAAAAGYFPYESACCDVLFEIRPPLPVARDLQLASTGTPRSVTIATEPPGLDITVDGTGYSSPQTFSWQPSSTHSIGTTSPQSPVPGTRYLFSSWSDGGAQSHAIAPPDEDTTYTAFFTTQYLLTTTASPAAGGSITAGGWFDPDTPVSIDATASSGYTFAGFTGDLTGTATPQTLVMNGPKTVVAHFVFTFTGFFPPVDNPPVLNVANAGRAIPVKFGLGGDRGLNIFASGSPSSQAIACDTFAPEGVVTETVTAGGSSLSYDAVTNRYTYVWKTDKSWTGCRELRLELIDGSVHTARFKLK